MATAIANSLLRGRNSACPQACSCRILWSLQLAHGSGAEFGTWGWRVPFLLSIILIGIGLWIRLGILETPVFQQLIETKKVEPTPIIEVIKRQPREIILSALLRVGQQAPFYIFTAFVFSYGVATLKMSRDLILIAVLVASCVSFVTIPLAGHISDRIGRRKTYLIGAVATGLFGFLYFGMLDTAIPSLVFIAIATSLIAHDFQYRPPGRANRRVVHPASTLQWLVTRLSTRLGHRRGSGAAYRDGAVRRVPDRICHRDLYRCLRGGESGIGGSDARLYWQGYLSGICPDDRDVRLIPGHEKLARPPRRASLIGRGMSADCCLPARS